MTTDMKYLALTAMLTATLWIPYIIAQVQTNGFLAPGNYRDPTPRPVPLWGRRADRTYMNAVETFAPFAALVIIAQLTGKANATTACCATIFFWLRATHAVVYLFGIPYIRTLVFTLSYAAVAVIFWQLIK
jgi:uncharacterized MAPEG superfamily protein